MSEPQVRTVRSFCRICTALCGVLVDVNGDGDGDRVVRVRGEADHPLSHGYTCAKGRALPRLHHDQSSTRTARRPSASSSAAVWAWTRPATGPRIRAGSVSLPYCHRAANVNVLTGKDESTG